MWETQCHKELPYQNGFNPIHSNDFGDSLWPLGLPFFFPSLDHLKPIWALSKPPCWLTKKFLDAKKTVVLPNLGDSHPIHPIHPPVTRIPELSWQRIQCRDPWHGRSIVKCCPCSHGTHLCRDETQVWIDEELKMGWWTNVEQIWTKCEENDSNVAKKIWRLKFWMPVGRSFPFAAVSCDRAECGFFGPQLGSHSTTKQMPTVHHCNDTDDRYDSHITPTIEKDPEPVRIMSIHSFSWLSELGNLSSFTPFGLFVKTPCWKPELWFSMLFRLKSLVGIW